MPSDFSPFPFNMIRVAYLEDRLKMLLSLLNAQFVENYVSDYAAAYGNILLNFASIFVKSLTTPYFLCFLHRPRQGASRVTPCTKCLALIELQYAYFVNVSELA